MGDITITMSFIKELKRRKVIRLAIVYLVAGIVILQGADVLVPALALPEWVLRLVALLLILGFPLSLVMAWHFDWTPDGLRRADSADDAALMAAPPDTKAESADEPAADTPIAPAKASVAVLPFTDMSEKRDQGYFCEGVAEAILNALTGVKNLQVASRTSSFRFKNASDDIRNIGKQLSVNTVLEGSVQKANDHLRVIAQLINVKDGYHLWSKQYDAELKDIFEIQDEIAQSIAEAQAVELSAQEQSAIKTASSKDVRAYEYYLRGRQFFHRLRGSDMVYARQMFDQAIEIDPDFALAWAGRADCYAFVQMYVKSDDTNRVEVTRSAERALELDSAGAESHASRGLAYLVCEQYDEAIKEFEIAIQISPTLFEPWYYYARASFHQGKLQKAADLFAKASEVNPEDYQSRTLRAQVLRGLGQVDLANEVGKNAFTVIEEHLKWHPDDARAFYLGAGSLAQLGERDRAKRWIGRALTIDPTDPVVLYNVACFYAQDGQGDKALSCLESAVDHGYVSGSWMKNDADLAPLRENPRFDALIERLQQ